MVSPEIKSSLSLSSVKERLDNDKQYDLSVITVCWNALPELKVTVESVLKQKHKNKIAIEHVVIDGASQDGTPEWLKTAQEEGKIEICVSEPDKGIYDAMNKGIALARGKVLAFINAGDGYTDEDISTCVKSIVDGVNKSVVGNADYFYEDGSFAYVRHYCPQAAYYDILGCHQAYFFDAHACRELGGYDAAAFRSAGDLDLMNKFLKRYGMPCFVKLSVCTFKLGGFSADAWMQYRSEFIEIQHRYWPELLQRCREERPFAAMMVSMLVRHCLVLGKMSDAELERIHRQKQELEEMLNTFSMPFRMPLKRLLLGLARRIAFRKHCSFLKNKTLSLCDLFCRVSYNNQYIFWGPKLIRYVRKLPFAKG